ncbi:hypothetical protein N7E02_00840 (plasmid) [Aliirhizobium terrae]|uniref:hypothetical protein n=1 Tax=Terrirhizobium terrae TaxID=2926709 RepID=UPI0025775D84|nr:hypothetical protein [Rhizobium sp. CC-CFT758]WJH38002.1 hypothetical protein N7E02_00840 [Rhizobium sp. CC-CFT758]
MEAAIHSRRQIIASLTFSTLAILLPFQANSALARGGHGGGDGSGGGRGGGNGSGNGGGADGRGDNRGGSGGNAGGKARGADPRGLAGGQSSGTQENGPAQGVNMTPGQATDRSLSVRHSNGMAEEIDSQGRYVMRDNRGRTIVNRSATQSDLDRLRSLTD